MKLFTVEGIIFSAAIMAACAAGALWVVRTPLFAVTTSVRPQSFSELYFADAAHLPQRVSEGKTYDIRFVIANHTGSDRQYSYTVSVQSVSSGKQEPPISVRIPTGGRSEQRYTLQPLVPGEPLAFSVTLDTNEVIRFYARP